MSRRAGRLLRSGSRRDINDRAVLDHDISRLAGALLGSGRRCVINVSATADNDMMLAGGLLESDSRYDTNARAFADYGFPSMARTLLESGRRCGLNARATADIDIALAGGLLGSGRRCGINARATDMMKGKKVTHTVSHCLERPLPRKGDYSYTFGSPSTARSLATRLLQTPLKPLPLLLLVEVLRLHRHHTRFHEWPRNPDICGSVSSDLRHDLPLS